jgi:16S rRNA (cytosine967-C5)-methyltransferase
VRKSSLIGHALEAFDLTRVRETPADQTLHAFFRQRHYLGSKDRRFIADTVYSMIRDERSLGYFAEQVLSPITAGRPVQPLALYLVLASRIHIQSHDGIVEDVAEIREGGRELHDLTVEAFLTRVSSIDPPLSVIRDPITRLAVTYSIPEFAVSRWLSIFGEGECTAFCAALNTPSLPSLRVNLLRASVATCRSALAAEGVDADPGRISPEGLILRKRVNAKSLAPFREGLFELQDEGSQLISHLVSPLPGETIADVCAGGGGKSLHMAALMNDKGQIYAADINAGRLKKSAERTVRAGVTIIKALETGLAGLSGSCDRVLVDAPCSGSGTWRRNPWLKRLSTPDSVAEYAANQRTILRDASALVQPGGRLVYATCSLFADENERVVENFLDGNNSFRLLNASEILHAQGIAGTVGDMFLRLSPHHHGTDGFFAAAMERSLPVR